jgi:hypothetical protein
MLVNFLLARDYLAALKIKDNKKASEMRLFYVTIAN